MLSSPARPDDYVPEDDEASELTRSSDVICGVHKLRAHKLRLSFYTLPDRQDTGGRARTVH